MFTVFQGGRLQYIDYDTKDVKLDKFAPMAYQVMALLLNYERTVKDFGHCSFNAGWVYIGKDVLGKMSRVFILNRGLNPSLDLLGECSDIGLQFTMSIRHYRCRFTSKFGLNPRVQSLCKLYPTFRMEVTS